jgi:hypothetical protein
MAYSTSNPPFLMVPSIGSKSALWGYSSTDGSTTVIATGYFTNGKELGMKVEDFMFTTVSSSSSMLLAKVTTVSSTGVTISAST